MIYIEVHNRKTWLYHRWSEISLATAWKLKELAEQLPEALREIWRLQLAGELSEGKQQELTAKISEAQFHSEIPRIYGEMMQLVSGITESEVRKLWPAEIKAFAREYVLPFVLGLLFFPDYEVQGIKAFKHKGTKYYLPSSKVVVEREIPGVELTALEFTEVADLQLAAASALENADKILAILCRPRKDGAVEPYDEDRCMKRAELFRSVGMDVVWEVFFCSGRLSNIFAQFTQISSLEKEVERNSRWPNTGGTPPS